MSLKLKRCVESVDHEATVYKGICFYFCVSVNVYLPLLFVFEDKYTVFMLSSIKLYEVINVIFDTL